MSGYAPVNRVEPNPARPEGTLVDGKPYWRPPGAGMQHNPESPAGQMPQLAGHGGQSDADTYVQTRILSGMADALVTPGDTIRFLIGAQLGHELVEASIIFTDIIDGEVF